MRGTLFATTPQQLAALLFFTGHRIRAMAARRREELGLDDGVLARSREALLPALAGMAWGERLRQSLSPQVFKRVLMLGLLALGIYMCARG